MRRYLLLLVVALLLPFVSAEAQKNCKKGIPCGNSCISATKTCRIGSPTTATRANTAQEVASADSYSSDGWVASTRGNTYYRAGCSGANKLSSANKVYFATEELARAAGYTRSRTKGC